jgi:UDP-glucose 4-epimerase
LRCARVICAAAASRSRSIAVKAGVSVLEVIETVKRVFLIDFDVAFVERRAGDPAQIVAAFNRTGGLLKWRLDRGPGLM